jgi:hypothetical protein
MLLLLFRRSTAVVVDFSSSSRQNIDELSVEVHRFLQSQDCFAN